MERDARSMFWKTMRVFLATIVTLITCAVIFQFVRICAQDRATIEELDPDSKFWIVRDSSGKEFCGYDYALFGLGGSVKIIGGPDDGRVIPPPYRITKGRSE